MDNEMAQIKLENVFLEDKYLEEDDEILGIFPADSVDDSAFPEGLIKLLRKCTKDKINVEWTYVDLIIGDRIIKDALTVVIKRRLK